VDGVQPPVQWFCFANPVGGGGRRGREEVEEDGRRSRRTLRRSRRTGGGCGGREEVAEDGRRSRRTLRRSRKIQRRSRRTGGGRGGREEVAEDGVDPVPPTPAPGAEAANNTIRQTGAGGEKRVHARHAARQGERILLLLASLCCF
jgi:hypothetical protein